MTGDLKKQKERELQEWKDRRLIFVSERFKRRNIALHEEVEKMTNMPFQEWWQKMQLLYEIDSNFTVTSRARDLKNGPQQWSNSSLIEAQEKVLQLMEFKVNDRNRGHGSHEKDKQRLRELGYEH